MAPALPEWRTLVEIFRLCLMRGPRHGPRTPPAADIRKCADTRSRADARPVTILQIVSCRGWSSDAYWAARATVELERAGHDVALVCKRRSEARVIRRARDEGVSRIEMLELTGWRVSGEMGAARLLGLKPTTLEARMRKLGIVRNRVA